MKPKTRQFARDMTRPCRGHSLSSSGKTLPGKSKAKTSARHVSLWNGKFECMGLSRGRWWRNARSKIMKIFLYIAMFVAFLFVSGLRADASSFANTTSISIRDTNTAMPYPSAITVSNLTGTVSTVTVTLSGLSHGSPSDIEMLLVGPTGKKFVFSRMQAACTRLST